MSPEDDQDTIHIFSVASGHMYERLQKIMILSVIRNTRYLHSSLSSARCCHSRNHSPAFQGACCQMVENKIMAVWFSIEVNGDLSHRKRFSPAFVLS